MTLEKALRTKDPLSNINNNISGTTSAQKSFTLLYAAILEVSSGGVSILFDRFTMREIRKICTKYNELNAPSLCIALETIQKVINKKLGPSPTKNKISEFLSFPPAEIKSIDIDRHIVEEMEKALLAYAKRSLCELKDQPYSAKTKNSLTDLPPDAPRRR